MSTLTIEDQEVLAHLAAEVDSIMVETGSDTTVSYEPQAYTREGHTD